MDGIEQIEEIALLRKRVTELEFECINILKLENTYLKGQVAYVMNLLVEARKEKNEI